MVAEPDDTAQLGRLELRSAFNQLGLRPGRGIRKSVSERNCYGRTLAGHRADLLGDDNRRHHGEPDLGWGRIGTTMKWLLLSIIVFATVFGDLLQSYEMKRSGEQAVDVRGLARLLKMIVSRRFLLLSIFCMAISFFAFMALVQIAPLSFAVPASAATFVLETLLAKFLLRETVGTRRAAGTLLVLGGVLLLAR